MKRKWRCVETKDEARWGVVIHTPLSFSEGFHRRKSMNE